MNNQVKLKKGDWVVMHTCGEATDPNNYGKLWRCRTDEYTQGQGVYKQNLVFLEGFSGCFLTEFLQKVNLPDTPQVPTIKPGDKAIHSDLGQVRVCSDPMVSVLKGKDYYEVCLGDLEVVE